jgi:hypothetical protein
MTKLRIEKGASRIRRVPLKTTIDGAVADDIELLCQWSENETSYVVNHLLRFALSQSEDFQHYKLSLENGGPSTSNRDVPGPLTAAPQNVLKTATPPARSPEVER